MIFFILLFIAIVLPIALVTALSPRCNRHHDDRRSSFYQTSKRKDKNGIWWKMGKEDDEKVKKGT